MEVNIRTGAIWVIIAEALLNLNDKAFEYFKMINPIEHSKTKEEANKYKVEPYVVAADVYGTGNLAGRGGWTWYTGSAGWMYTAGLKYILGINIQDDTLKVEPHTPSNWNNYSVRLKYGQSIYNIKMEKDVQDEEKHIQEISINGEKVNQIKLEKSGGIYNINIKY